jgi:hypothetical protein
VAGGKGASFPPDLLTPQPSKAERHLSRHRQGSVCRSAGLLRGRPQRRRNTGKAEKQDSPAQTHYSTNITASDLGKDHFPRKISVSFVPSHQGGLPRPQDRGYLLQLSSGLTALPNKRTQKVMRPTQGIDKRWKKGLGAQV